MTQHQLNRLAERDARRDMRFAGLDIRPITAIKGR